MLKIFLWNKTVEILVKRGIKKEKAPVFGFGTEVKDKEIEGVIKGLLKQEGLTSRDFIIKSFPELSVEGVDRDMFMEVKDLFISNKEEDELNQGKFKIKISFSLNKGSYATVVIKSLFS